MKRDDIVFKGEYLTKKDIIHNFSIDNDHYMRIYRYRRENGLPLSSDFLEKYDNRDGYYITGEKIDTKHHPYHDKCILDTKRNITYRIDTISIDFMYGKYITIGMRELGSESHKHIIFENINSRSKFILDSLKKNKHFKLVDKVEDIESDTILRKVIDTKFDHSYTHKFENVYQCKWHDNIFIKVDKFDVYVSYDNAETFEKYLTIDKYDDIPKLKKIYQGYGN